MAENPATEKKFEVIEYEGKQVRKYPDGTLRGEHGHIVGQSTQRARELGQKRREQGAQIVRNRIKESTGSESYAEGYGKLVDKMVDAVMTETGRSRNDAMRFLALAAGSYAPSQTTEVRGAIQHVPVSPLPAEFWEYMERRVAEKRDAVEGEANDVQDD